MPRIHWLWYTLPFVSIPGLERLLCGPLPPIQTDLTATRVLAVAAHPDDLEYFCGGTLALLAQQGAHVTAVIATRGEQGGNPGARRQEQERAAAHLGYGRLWQLDFPDRGVRAALPRVREELSTIIAHEQPDLLLTFDPIYPHPIYQHSDHMAVARAALALWPGDALLFHTRRPTLAVEVTSVFTHKLAAFGAHRSQLPVRARDQLIGWHLACRNRKGRDAYVELFRTVTQQHSRSQ